MTSDFLVIGSIGLFCAFLGFIVWLATSESKKTIAKLSMVLPEAGKIDFHLHAGGTANYAGQKYHYLFNAGSKNSPRRLSISIDAPCPAQFAVVKETTTDVFFKKLGINQEIQTGDLDFDQKYYILSNDSEFVSPLLRAASCRDAFRLIFETGFTEVSLRAGKLDATWTGFDFPANAQSEAIARVIDALRQILKNIPVQGPAMVFPSETSQFGQWPRYAIHALPYVLGVIGFTFLVMATLPLDTYAFFLKSLLISLPSLIAVIYLASKVLRGRASSGRELIFFLVAGIMGVLLFFHGYGAYLNNKNDHSSPMRHQVVVAGKHIERNKSSTYYSMDIVSWRESRGIERLRVSQDFYHHIQPGKTRVQIVSRAGAFRYEWVESYSVVD